MNNTKGWVEGTTRGDEADIKVWPPKQQAASMTAPTM
jgi:hypothetical protein